MRPIPIYFLFFLMSLSAMARQQTESISQKVKNWPKKEGFFTFYYDEGNGKIYLEVDKLDYEFLYFSSLTDGVGSGGPERGQASSAIARFSKVGPKILLIQPNYAFRATSGNED